MCSGIGDIDGVDFVSEEAEFLKLLKESKDSKSIEGVVDERKKEVEGIIPLNKSE